MGSKLSNVYVCSSCDAQFSKWNGRCLECGAWGTLTKEIKDDPAVAKKDLSDVEPAKVIDLSKLDVKDIKRLETKISEVDRVLGGGFMPGSLLLLSGEPGIGKSTVLLQIASAIANTKGKVVYVSGEESPLQIKDRMERLKCPLDSLSFVAETNVEKILATLIKNKPKLAIIDSIQTVYSSLIPSEAGSVSQIRAATVRFLQIAKENNIIIILVGHITKDGQVAGPKTLEHIVDTVLNLETEKNHDYRILRSTKNRFGTINELGIFEMGGQGLKEIKNPSAVFLEGEGESITGSVISCVMEGTRPFLVEVQALVTKTVFGYPQRKVSGFDLNRLQVLCAVLTKRAGINLTNQDVILNIAGGFKVSDPGVDLAVCLAIASSLLNQKVEKSTLALGEVGLGGELRNVGKIKERIKEAEKLGFTKILTPYINIKNPKAKLIKFKKASEVIGYLKR